MMTPALRRTAARAVLAIGLLFGLLFAGSAPFDFGISNVKPVISVDK